TAGLRPSLGQEEAGTEAPGRVESTLEVSARSGIRGVEPMAIEVPQAPLVGVEMGSKSDWETLRHAGAGLAGLGSPYQPRVVSVHRTPERLDRYGREAEDRGLEVLIAGAGGAAHLPGMLAALSLLPVLGVPVESQVLRGVDSLLSIVQMPRGVPVGTLAIGGVLAAP